MPFFHYTVVARPSSGNSLVEGFSGCVLHTRWIPFIKLKRIDFANVTAWHDRTA